MWMSYFALPNPKNRSMPLSLARSSPPAAALR